MTYNQYQRPPMSGRAILVRIFDCAMGGLSAWLYLVLWLSYPLAALGVTLVVLFVLWKRYHRLLVRDRAAKRAIRPENARHKW